MSYEEFKELLNKAREDLMYFKRPFVLYDDDPDGITSYILMKRHLGEDKSIMLKSSPKVSTQFIPKIKEYEPDVIIILDKPLIDEDFIEQTDVPIYWFDHHTKEKILNKRLIEINPRDYGVKEYPTAHIVYDFMDKKTKDNEWVAAVGCIGDWTKPRFFEQLKEDFPDLIEGREKIEEVLFDSKLGTIIKKFSLISKLPTNKYKKVVKYLVRCKDPYEILENTTEDSKYFSRSIADVEKEYDALIEEARKQNPEGDFIIFIYDALKNSFTKEISNEMLYRYPNKTIVIGRRKEGIIKMSIRSPKIIPDALKRALTGIRGHGGGHEHACGSLVEEEDFPRFIEQLKHELK